MRVVAKLLGDRVGESPKVENAGLVRKIKLDSNP